MMFRLNGCFTLNLLLLLLLLDLLLILLWSIKFQNISLNFDLVFIQFIKCSCSFFWSLKFNKCIMTVRTNPSSNRQLLTCQLRVDIFIDLVYVFYKYRLIAGFNSNWEISYINFSICFRILQILLKLQFFNLFEYLILFKICDSLLIR